MLIVGYCFGIRSERRLCEEVHLNLAYRWFCRLGLDGDVPDHFTFSKNRHGRFRDSDLLRRVFEAVLQRCICEGLVGGAHSTTGEPRVQTFTIRLPRFSPARSPIRAAGVLSRPSITSSSTFNLPASTQARRSA